MITIVQPIRICGKFSLIGIKNSLGVVPFNSSDFVMVVLFELMIASILSMEQVSDCKISLYSPPQAGYGTSSVESGS